LVAEPTVSPAAAEYASDFFQRYDRNGDGWVDKDEPPLAVRKFLFQDFDRDGNQRLDLNEVRTVATERLK
jgi:Ca2+-binding EF-hand superfamily protein